ncbi:DUF3093 domain-containing protein [Solwaraspora sp. WMMD406]|uniref:DUF3093 domain-containing protein n=1 Tax=Solwaraspora sp. WMMD406 TaxID=3016095 RepID=UPI002416D623|nr:DUF3093 domain-containing protein [Solwaraspora sp. WMMD406]MDG4767003.1 DUF3093 domain-containing protein [Solwaraspora sp. WMMD406]
MYRERLHLSWWLWAGALGLTALLAAEIWMGTSGARAWLPFTVLLPLTAGGLWWLGRIPIRVTADDLRVDDARLPLRYVADVVALDADGRRELLGVAADPLAFVIQRPWIGGAVQIVLDDPADPTPYWVISSRHPIELATAIGSHAVESRVGESRVGESRVGGSTAAGSDGRGSASGRADPEG